MPVQTNGTHQHSSLHLGSRSHNLASASCLLKQSQPAANQSNSFLIIPHHIQSLSLYPSSCLRYAHPSYAKPLARLPYLHDLKVDARPRLAPARTGAVPIQVLVDSHNQLQLPSRVFNGQAPSSGSNKAGGGARTCVSMSCSRKRTSGAFLSDRME